MEFLPLLFIIAALGTLITLSIIDLRTWLLPDPLNLLLALLGIGFHIVIGFKILPPHDLIFGALLGSGLLYIIRFFGNRIYKQDSLGLGDVKLLGAAGFWLGLEGVIAAITLGALAGVIHGIGIALYRSLTLREKFNLKQLALPAGPGFCVGIVLAGLWVLGPYFGLTIYF
jgi:prepilin signal peptidase PulO-like enzyme (type II secretory pathway)